MTWASLSIEKVFLMGKVFNIHFDLNCRNYEFRKHLGIYLENHEKNVRYTLNMHHASIIGI